MKRQIAGILALVMIASNVMQPISTVFATTSEVTTTEVEAISASAENQVLVITGASLNQGEEEQTITAGSATGVSLPKVAVTYSDNTEEDIEVTWISEKEFDINVEGTYIYKATLDETKYTLGEGVEIPDFTVEVKASTEASDGVTAEETSTDEIPAEEDAEEEEGEEEEPVATTLSLTGPTFEITNSRIPLDKAAGEAGVGQWNYLEDTGALIYSFRVSHDPTLPEGTDRTLKIDINPYGVVDSTSSEEVFPFYIQEYPSSATAQMSGGALSADKTELTYTVKNSSITPESAVVFSITITPNFDTTYAYKDSQNNGTPAAAIGNMLLHSPNARLGISIDDTSTSIADPIVYEHVLNRSGQSDEPALEGKGIASSTLKPLDYNLSTDLWLGSDGYLYFRKDGTGEYVRSDSAGLRTEFTDEIHTPVGSVAGTFYAPPGFYFPSGGTDSEGNKYSQFVMDKISVSGGDLTETYSTSVSSGYVQSTSITDAEAAMLGGSLPLSDAYKQWHQIRLTGTGTWVLRGTDTLFNFDDQDVYTANKDSKVTYDQVVSDGDGTYSVENREVNHGKITVNVPDYKYENRLEMITESPIYVNEEDNEETRYYFSVDNKLKSTDVQDEITHYYYQNETMTFEMPEEFTPTSLVKPNSGAVIKSYTITYSDGTEVTQAISSTSTTTITIPESYTGATVESLSITFDERGIVKSDYSVGYETDWYFTGAFTEPTDGSEEIVMPITVTNSEHPEGTATPEALEWKYKPGVDNLEFDIDYTRASTTEGYSEGAPYFVSNDKSIPETGFKSGYTTPLSLAFHGVISVDRDGGLTAEEQISSSLIYRDVTIDFTAENKAHIEQLYKSFRFYYIDSNRRYQIYGDAWVEYTTSASSAVRTMELTSTTNSYTLPLVEGEYITSFKFRMEGLRILSDENKGRYGTLFTMFYANDRNTPSGQIPADTQTLTATITANGEGEEGAKTGVFKDPDNAKQIDTVNHHFIYEHVARIETLSIGKDMTMPETSTRGEAIDEEITFSLPLYRSSVSNVSNSYIRYPEGTAAYLNINEEYFTYAGDDERISIIEVTDEDGNKDKWLKYDLEGIVYSTSSTEITNTLTIPANTILTDAKVKDQGIYHVFTDGYVDFAPIDVLTGEKNFFVNYVPGTTTQRESNAIVDNIGITDSVGIEYVDDEGSKMPRLANIHTNKTILTVIKSTDSINLFPGKELDGGGVSAVYSGVNYYADEYDELVLGMDIASPTKNLKSYNLFITLPTEGETITDLDGKSYESDTTIRLRNLEDSVALPDFGSGVEAKVTYYSEADFDIAKTSYLGIEEGATEVNKTSGNPEDVKYILIEVPVVEKTLNSHIQLKVDANTNDMYTDDHKSVGYAYAEAKYHEQTGEAGGEPIYSEAITGTTANGIGKFIFNWYKLEGMIYEEALTVIPNGLFEFGKGDSFATITTEQAWFKDLQPETDKEIEAIYEPSTGEYYLLIQPKGNPLSATTAGRVKYDLIFDLNKNGLWDEYRMSYLNNDGEYLETNSNFPRQNNGQTEGVQFYADIHGFTTANTSYVSQEELDKGWVDVALYQNPQIVVSQPNLIIEETEEIDIAVTLVGQGSLTDDEVYIEQDDPYITTTPTKTDDKNYTVKVKGDLQTLKDGSQTELVAKLATTNATNYFGEVLEKTTDYTVYLNPYVTFHVTSTDSNEGTWRDTTINEDAIDVDLQTASVTARYGTLLSEDVPRIEAPTGYAFAGWEYCTEGSLLPGSTRVDPSTYTSTERYADFYPIFLTDIVGGIDEETGKDTGDGIPDIYQVKIQFKTTEGGFITKNDVDITNTTDAFVVYKTRYKGDTASHLYPDPLYHPSNWTSSTSYRITLEPEDVPTYEVYEHYTYIGWKSNNPVGTWMTTDDIVNHPNGFAPNEVTLTATFTRNKENVTFIPAIEGQGSIETATLVVDEGTNLTDADFTNSLGVSRSEPAYGYEFVEWERIDPETGEVIDRFTQEELEALEILEDYIFRAKFSPIEYNVNFEIYDESGENPLEDSVGNEISHNSEKNVLYSGKLNGSDVPGVTAVDEGVWKDIMEFAYWEYTMSVEPEEVDPETGEPIPKTVTGQTNDPSSIVITGDVTFTAHFGGKPFVAITHTGNAQVGGEKFTDAKASYDAFNLESEAYASLELFDSIDSLAFGGTPKPDNGYYDVGLKFDANDTYKVVAIRAHALYSTANDTQVIELWKEDGSVNTDVALETLQLNTPATEIVIELGKSSATNNFEDLGYIKVNNIGGETGTPCAILFEVETERVKHPVTFEPGVGGIISAENTAFVENGGVLPTEGETNATQEVTHNDKGLIFPEVEVPEKKVLDYWVIVDEDGKETKVTETELINSKITGPTTYKAVYADDENGDGVADYKQTIFIYKSSDEEKLTVTDTTTENEKIEYITGVEDEEGDSKASPTGEDITKTFEDSNKFGTDGWKFYTLDEEGNKVYIKADGSEDDLVVSGDAALKDVEFEVGQTIYIEATVVQIGYDVIFEVKEDDGTIPSGELVEEDKVYREIEDVRVGDSVEITPDITANEGKTFVGWKVKDDDKNTIVNPKDYVVNDKDLVFEAVMMPEYSVETEADLVIKGDGFTIPYDETGELTIEQALENADAEGWSSTTGQKYPVTMGEEELQKIKDVGPNGGIVEVEITTTDGENTVTKTILVTVTGKTTPDTKPTESGHNLTITGNNFTMEQEELPGYNENVSEHNSSVESFVVETNEEITDITPNPEHMEAIKNAGENGGFFPQEFTATEDGGTVSTTVTVVVKGTQTDVTSQNGVSIGITALGFVVPNEEAKDLDDAKSITKSDAEAMILETSEDVKDITVNQDELEVIQNVGPNGGIFPLTYTATKLVKDPITGAETTLSVSTTVNVVVPGTDVDVDVDAESDLAIQAKDFVIPYTEAVDITTDIAKTKSDVSALLAKSGVDIPLENITITEEHQKQLDAIKKVNKEDGGNFPLTFTATDENGNTVETTITVTVLPVPKYDVTFEIPENGKFDDETTTQLDKVFENEKVDTTPNVNPDTDYEFVGWYVKGDKEETIVDPTKSPVTGDITYEAKLVPSYQVEKDGDIVLKAEGFTLEQKDLEPLTKEDVLENAGASSWNSKTGEIYEDVTISDEDLERIKSTGPEGDILDVVVTATDGQGNTVEKTIKVVVLGTDVKEDEKTDIAIKAKDFTIPHEEAGTITDEIAKLKSEVEAAIGKTGEEITDITVDQAMLDRIKNAPTTGGEYPLTFTATDKDGNKVETTIYVTVEPVVEPESTPAPTPGPEPTPEPTPVPAPETSPDEGPIQLPEPEINEQEEQEEPEEESDSEEEEESAAVALPNDGAEEPDWVEVDGEPLSEEDYFIDENGNLVLTPEFIKTLEDGEHIIRISIGDEEYEAVMVIENGVPLAMGVFERVGGAWSLFDLIMTILAAIFALGYTIIRPRNGNEEDEDEVASEEEEEKKHKKRIVTSGVLALLAVFNIILFILTQDLTQPMIIFDIYSIIFAIVVIAQVLIMYFIRKKNDEEDEDEERVIM